MPKIIYDIPLSYFFSTQSDYIISDNRFSWHRIFDKIITYHAMHRECTTVAAKNKLAPVANSSSNL